MSCQEKQEAAEGAASKKLREQEVKGPLIILGGGRHERRRLSVQGRHTVCNVTFAEASLAPHAYHQMKEMEERVRRETRLELWESISTLHWDPEDGDEGIDIVAELQKLPDPEAARKDPTGSEATPAPVQSELPEVAKVCQRYQSKHGRVDSDLPHIRCRRMPKGSWKPRVRSCL
jgi:hypothetical protein